MLSSLAIQVNPQFKNFEQKIYLNCVDQVIYYIDSTKLKYEVGPFETVVMGDLAELLKIIERAQKICLEYGADSVISHIKLNYAKNDVLGIEEKVEKFR